MSDSQFEAAAGGAVALALAGIARRFGRRWVLRGVSLRVERGEVLALTGRNGSGKTTLLRVLTTGLRPTRGTGRVFGLDLLAQAPAVRAQVGMLGHHAGLYEDLTGGENLSFAMRMYGWKVDEERIASVLDQVGLAAERDERVRGFSAGMRRRLALGRLLLRPPRLLLLDEPYASFDADGVVLVNAFAAQVAAAGGAVLVATHELERGRGLVDRTIRIEDGLLADDAPQTAGTSMPGTLLQAHDGGVRLRAVEGGA